MWADFFNGHPSPEARALENLIEDEAELVTCGLIACEVLQGLKAGRSLTLIERQFRDMEWLSPSEPDSYVRAADLFRRLRSRGITIRSTIDCLIATMAADSRTVILSKDRDLAAIVKSKLLDLRSLNF